ncbi:ParB N-terminal domain-containing protein [Clostridium sp. WLY-B-L2]|uniref:ParB N-terminal domain-containing protein n=1 Tax=Clostridium aromativorans TaxID=2836848 RepID=A0ABS8N9P3_9CLOT|nr:ParB N-terminal domain-containing protein [Clostridium aromativorans]MCC9296524.1 ParB N-terminal domain-containing protein [Clostridium aromativorans]
MLIDIDKITVNKRIRKDFGNIDELAEDIKENGLINPPVVTPEFHLIAGERRLRALEYLGYEQVEVRVMAAKDYEHQFKLEISENENRKDFTFSERIEYARKLEEIERVKAEKRRLANLKQNTEVESFPPRAEQGKTREIVAEKSGFGSGKTFEKAKYISENASEEMIKSLDEGKLSINKAYMELRKSRDEALKKAKEAEKTAGQEKQEKEELAKKYMESKKRSDEIEKKYKLKLSEKPHVVKKEIIPNDYEEFRKRVSVLEAEKKKLEEQNIEKDDELEKKNEELAALSRAEIQLKNKYKVRHELANLVQEVNGSTAKIELLMKDIDNLEDMEITNFMEDVVESLCDSIEKINSLNKNRKGDVVNAEFEVG